MKLKKILAFSLASTVLSLNVISGALAESGNSAMIDNWPATPKKVAKMMIDKYGQPNEATASMLLWNNNGPWKRTIVYREEVKHNFPMPHTDLLQQFINFKVQSGMANDLGKYDGSVIIDKTKGEISARCDGEDKNMLALNLANDILMHKKTVKMARQFYSDTVMAKMKMGKSSPYLEKLLFIVPKGGTNDPDMPLMGMKMGKMKK